MSAAERASERSDQCGMRNERMVVSERMSGWPNTLVRVNFIDSPPILSHSAPLSLCLYLSPLLGPVFYPYANCLNCLPSPPAKGLGNTNFRRTLQHFSSFRQIISKKDYQQTHSWTWSFDDVVKPSTIFFFFISWLSIFSYQTAIFITFLRF